MYEKMLEYESKDSNDQFFWEAASDFYFLLSLYWYHESKYYRIWYEKDF